jgi:hypothetical protein
MLLPLAGSVFSGPGRAWRRRNSERRSIKDEIRDHEGSSSTVDLRKLGSGQWRERGRS